MNSKSQKKLVLMGAAKFNIKPKLGVAFIDENLNPTEPRKRNLARFLKSCTRVDKRLVGDYISRDGNAELLEEFIGLFDFKNVVSSRSFIFLSNPPVVHRNTLQTQCAIYWQPSDSLVKHSK